MGILRQGPVNSHPPPRRPDHHHSSLSGPVHPLGVRVWATKKLLPVCQLTLIIKPRSPVLVFYLVHLVSSSPLGVPKRKRSTFLYAAALSFSLSLSLLCILYCTLACSQHHFPALRKGLLFFSSSFFLGSLSRARSLSFRSFFPFCCTISRVLTTKSIS